MRSERKTTGFGSEYIQFYDDEGNRVGTAEPMKDMFGDTVYRYYDNDRNIIGEGKEETDFWGNYRLVDRDNKGNIVGTSENSKDIFGNDQIVHKDRDGNRVGISEQRTSLFGDTYTHTEINDSGRTSRSGEGGSVGSPIDLPGITVMIMSILLILALVGIYLFMHKLDDAGVTIQLTTIFEQFSKWCLIGVIIGGIIFFVSRKASASISASLTEAVLGGALYQTLYWNFLNDSTGNYSGPYFGLISADSFSGFSGLIFPIILLSPMVICTICLAVGSSGNQKLRDSYIKMNNWLYKTNAVIIGVWFILMLTGFMEGVWNGFFVMLIVFLWYFFGAYVCMKINNIILKK
ncbi:MAG: hypothetical protein IKS37_02735 [Solobacterium sp.]|nr:hypothetical protein [Solobacterium sp.]